MAVPTIVSSVIQWNLPQADGRANVRELHTDSLGATYIFDYIWDESISLTTHLFNDAQTILPALAIAEVANNLASIASLGMYATAVTIYSTSAQNVAALQAAWPTYTNTQAIYTGEYINNLSNAQIEAAFGFTPTQTANYRTAYWQPYATLAASLRTASGSFW